MPTPLTPQEQVLMEEDTDYLSIDIPVFTSKVIVWNGRNILVFSSANDGYYTTDISDLGGSVINQLATQSTVQSTAWGMIYNLPQAVSDTIASEANTSINIAKSVGTTAAGLAQAVSDAIGKTLAALLGPVVNSLMPVLVIAGLVLLAYFMPKKG
jgi:ethanolamine utilization microcompartment shell protein EutL